MDRIRDIPCAACKSWNAKDKKFSCNPKKCQAMSTWLLEHIPQLSTETFTETLQMQMALPEEANQYIV